MPLEIRGLLRAGIHFDFLGPRALKMRTNPLITNDLGAAGIGETAD